MADESASEPVLHRIQGSAREPPGLKPNGHDMQSKDVNGVGREDEEGDQGEAEEHGVATSNAADLPAAKKKRKKRKTRPQGQKGLVRGTIERKRRGRICSLNFYRTSLLGWSNSMQMPR